MTTIYNNSFESSPNSDSDDDFMVDSIIEHQPSHSESNNRNVNNIPSWMTKDMKCDQMYNIVRGNNVGRLPLKRNLASLQNHFVKNERCTKIIKLTSDKIQYVNTQKSIYPKDNYFTNDSIEININNDDAYIENLSNVPSPYAESDKTHSVESSPSCILLNDPIITSVVLNEKRFNSPNDSMNRLTFDDNLFTDMPTSFEKSNFSTSIDDNLLTPMRNYQFFAGSSENYKKRPIIIRNNSLNLSKFSIIESSKRSKSIGSDQEILSRDKRVRSSENLSVRKYVPISIVSETTSDCAHSLSTTAPIVNNYSKKIISNNNGHNKRKHLLQFIIDLLKEGHTCVNWSNKKDNEFFIAQPEKLALLWATYKNNNKMTFDSLARSLRLYYAPKKLERISGKKNHYRILNLSHEISFNL